MIGTTATRGQAFYWMDRMFSQYEIGEGKTVYTTYTDTTPPRLTVDSLPNETKASSVTVAGIAMDAESVTVNGRNVTLGSDGAYSMSVALTLGQANAIEVIAVDLAGNTARKLLTVTRLPGDPAAIEAGDLTVEAGQSVDTVTVDKNADGAVVSTANITGTSTMGSYANGKFTAGERAGNGTLTYQSGSLTKTVNVTVKPSALVRIGASVSDPSPGTHVMLTAHDKFGNKISEGVMWSVSPSDASIGAATGDFIAIRDGSYTVTASKGGVSQHTRYPYGRPRRRKIRHQRQRQPSPR